MYIKPLTSEHYRSVKDIFGESFYQEDHDNTDLSYYWRLRDREESVGAFTKEGDLLGFSILIRPAGNPNNRYLAYIAVHSRFRGCGAGSAIMNHMLLKRAASSGGMHLVPLDHKGLRPWYASHGFKDTWGHYMNYHSYGTRQRSKAIHP